MYDNPGTLKDICIDYVCNNIEKLYMAEQISEPDSHSPELEYMFIDNDMFLPMEVSEVLLTKLSERNKLNDETLALFSHKNVYLRLVNVDKFCIIYYTLIFFLLYIAYIIISHFSVCLVKVVNEY